MRKTELLLPAGSPEILKTAIHYGADAVYLGGEEFGLRANAQNFSLSEIREAVLLAHQQKVKVYVTANIYAHNQDMTEIRSYFSELKDSGIDAVLVADPGVFLIAKEVMPNVDIHVSTQANNTNFETFRFWHQLGATRVVCARELSLEEIREIRRNIPEEMEIEAFVHGAMCMSYSGRCLLSSFLTGRDANRGECTHPCRWKYSVQEEKRPGEYFPMEENERGTFIFNSRDLCMIEHIPELLEAGVDSLKIEGRMKTALYVATVARTYRKATDDYLNGGTALYQKHLPWYREEIRKCTYREYTTAFYFGKPSAEDQIYDNNTYTSGATYLGTVERAEGRDIFLTQKNKFSVGQELTILKNDGRDLRAEVLGIFDEESGEAQESCPHSRQKLRVSLSVPAESRDVLRLDQ